MKAKLLVLVAGATGYVLGARAGRQRYDQIAASAGRLWGNPKVQQRVTDLEDKATDVAKQAGAVAGQKVSETASTVKDKVSKSDTSSKSGTSGGGAAGTATGSTVTVEDHPLGDQHHTRLPTD